MACDSFSPKMATSTFAPVTSFLPTPCTCSTARWITRWKPLVGWVSILLFGGNTGTFSLRKLRRFRRSSSMLPPHARSTRDALGLSSSAISRCSTVMNSCRLSRAVWKAAFRENSSSCDSIDSTSGPGPIRGSPLLLGFQGALQRMLVLLGVRKHLSDLRLRDLPRVDPAHPDSLLMHVQHDARGLLSI